MDLAKLKEPFAPSDIEWRIGQAGKGRDGKVWAKVLAYVTARAIEDRLDEVVGPANWQNEFKFVEGGVLCGISINTEHGWVTKWDGSDPSDIEAFKGSISGAMKRAAVQWGVGRYLYDLGETWAQVLDSKQDGAHYANCKIKVDGKEEWASFYWLPPRNVLPGGKPEPAKKSTAKKIADEHGMKTADELPQPKPQTTFQRALDEITKSVRNHDMEHLTTVATLIGQRKAEGKLTEAEYGNLVAELTVAERKIEALKNEPVAA